jgi:hypothetical protein
MKKDLYDVCFERNRTVYAEQFGETCGTGQLISIYVNMYEEISGKFQFMESRILFGI